MSSLFFRCKPFFAALLWLLCCQFAQAQTPQKMGPGMLWEIKSGKHVVYLFGSFHLGRADFFPLPKSVDDAFKASKLLVVEADITAPDLAEKVKNMFFYPAPDKLENHLSQSTWSKLKQQFGETAETFQSTRLGAINTGLVVGYLSAHGYAADKGIDLHYLQRARAAKKPIGELEGIEYQVKLLNQFSDAEAEAWLLQVLQAMNSGAMLSEVENMAQAWLAGDELRLAQILQQSTEKDEISQKMTQIFFTERNPNLSKTIVKLLKEGKQAFIVMGAGHCVGAGNVVELLQKQGVSVRRVYADKAGKATLARQ